MGRQTAREPRTTFGAGTTAQADGRLSTVDVRARSQLDRLKTLIEISRALTAELDVKDIIGRILEGAIKVIPAAEAGILFLYDPEQRRLVVNHAVGFGPAIYDLSVRPGEGLSGHAFVDRKAQMYVNREAVKEVMRGAQAVNLRAFAEASWGTDFPQSALSAPLVYKGETIGAMVVENLQRQEVFQPFDVSVLDALAQAAAIAIVNARLYAAEHESRLRLEALNEEIKAQRDQLERRLQIQDSLVEVVRDELPLGALATRLARITQSSVIIADSLFHLRASDVALDVETLLELDLCPWESLRPALREAARTRGPQRLPARRGVLTVYPVSAGPETLGFVLLKARDAEPDAIDLAAADSASLIAATRFLRERALQEGEVRRRGVLLERLLRGEVPGGGQDQRHVQPPVRLVVGRLRELAQEDHDSPQPLRTFLAVTQEELQRTGRPVAVTTKDGEVVAVQSLAGHDAPAESGTERALENAADRVERLLPGWQATYAVQLRVDGLAEVADAYEEARLALGLRAELGGRERVFNVRSLGAFRLIMRAASSADAVELCRRVLRPVLEQDRAHSFRLLNTFRAYLENGTAIRATAAQLGVHPHTVEYRLSRLQQLSGLHLRRPEDRLTLELAMRVLDLSGILFGDSDRKDVQDLGAAP
jgi:GAF domain-containing protein